MDFRILRSHPIYKESRGNYYFVYGYFLLELIYKGVYFKLNELNAKLPKNQQIKGFRSFYCDYFSEQTLLYNVLKDVYGKKYIQMPGDYIKMNLVLLQSLITIFVTEIKSSYLNQKIYLSHQKLKFPMIMKIFRAN